MSVRNKKRTSRAMLTAKHCIEQMVFQLSIYHSTSLQTLRASKACLHHEDEGEATPKNQEHLKAVRLLSWSAQDARRGKNAIQAWQHHIRI